MHTFGYVPRDFGETDKCAAFIVDGLQERIGPEPAAVFPDVPPFGFVTAIAAGRLQHLAGKLSREVLNYFVRRVIPLLPDRFTISRSRVRDYIERMAEEECAGVKFEGAAEQSLISCPTANLTAQGSVKACSNVVVGE